MPMNVPTPSLGRGQTWQDVTASRASATTYTNTTGKPILVSIEFSYASNSRNIVVDGVQVSSASSTAATFTKRVGICAIVPPGSTYRSDGAAGINQWAELR